MRGMLEVGQSVAQTPLWALAGTLGRLHLLFCKTGRTRACPLGFRGYGRGTNTAPWVRPPGGRSPHSAAQLQTCSSGIRTQLRLAAEPFSASPHPETEVGDSSYPPSYPSPTPRPGPGTCVFQDILQTENWIFTKFLLHENLWGDVLKPVFKTDNSTPTLPLFCKGSF